MNIWFLLQVTHGEKVAGGCSTTRFTTPQPSQWIGFRSLEMEIIEVPTPLFQRHSHSKSPVNWRLTARKPQKHSKNKHWNPCPKPLIRIMQFEKHKLHLSVFCTFLNSWGWHDNLSSWLATMNPKTTPLRYSSKKPERILIFRYININWCIFTISTHLHRIYIYSPLSTAGNCLGVRYSCATKICQRWGEGWNPEASGSQLPSQGWSTFEFNDVPNFPILRWVFFFVSFLKG